MDVSEGEKKQAEAGPQPDFRKGIAEACRTLKGLRFFRIWRITALALILSSADLAANDAGSASP